MYWYYRDKLQIISLPGVLGFRKLYRVQTIKPRVKWENEKINEKFPHLRTINRENFTELKLIVVSRKKNKIAIFHYKLHELYSSNRLQNENWFVSVKLLSSETLYSPNDVIC